MASKFLNISTDTTLGGSSASDNTVASQKAVKSYVDSQTGTAPSFANITGQPTDNANLATALNAKYDASNPSGYQANVIETVKVNGTALTPSNKAVDVSVPTNNNQLTNGAGYITGIPYGESTSAEDAVQKEVTISEITELKTGQIIIVKPTITSTVANATLKLNNFTAYPILYGTAAITTSTDSITWAANYPSWFRFDGSNWVFLGHGADNNTTYSAMSVSEGTTGTKTTARSVRADYLKQIIQGTKLTGLSTSTNSAVVETDTMLVGMGKLQAQVNTKQSISNLVTSVSSSSTDSQYPSAKLFYDTCGDIESAINTIRGV